MRVRTFFAAGLLAFAGFTTVPAQGETVEYYVWTDDNGVTQIGDVPPKNRPYDTRTVDADANIVSGRPVDNPSVESSASRSSDNGESAETSTVTKTDNSDLSGLGTAILVDELEDRGFIERGPGFSLRSGNPPRSRPGRDGGLTADDIALPPRTITR